MRSRILVLLLLAVAAGSLPLRAQPLGPRDEPVRVVVPPPGLHQELQLRTGDRVVGRVVRVEADTVVFVTLAGDVLRVPRSAIISVTPVDGETLEQACRPADAHATRLLFGPTGRSLRRGEGYVGLYEFFMPFVQVGLTDRVSIGGGTPLLFGAGVEHPFWVTPKVQLVSRGRLQVAAGAMHLVNVSDTTAGIVYSVMTFGTTDAAVTGGAGWTYSSGDEASGSAAIVMVGGERRISGRTKVITENYWFEGNAGLLMIGIRLLGNRVSGDFAMVMPIGGQGAVAFPMVNFVWGF